MLLRLSARDTVLFNQKIGKLNFETKHTWCIKKKGNPTLACHCALITGCMNVNFAWLQKNKVLAVE